MEDPFNLERFVIAQDRGVDGDDYASAFSELQRGRKTGHWIWYVFPQLKGLAPSATSKKYGISSKAEAQAYLKHPVLGQRLRRCTELLNRIEGSSASQIFGPDIVKVFSCLTLFAEVEDEGDPFSAALAKFFGGARDSNTVGRLRGQSSP